MAGLLFYQDPSLSPGISAATTSAFAGGLSGGAYFKHDGTNITSLGGATTAGMVQ